MEVKVGISGKICGCSFCCGEVYVFEILGGGPPLQLHGRAGRCIFIQLMEGRLIIFLACVAVTLIVNTVIIYMVFRVFGNLTTKITEGVHEFQAGSPTRQWLAAMQSASENAARVTGIAKEHVAGLETVLAQMQAEHAQRLAKADVRFKLAFRAIHVTVAAIDGVVTWPIRHLRKVSPIVDGIFSFIRGRQSDSDARSRRTR